MNYQVYVLFSSSHKKIYVGYTSNLAERMLSHNELGKKGYSLLYRPWVIVFTEDFQTKPDAMRREKALKGGQGRAYIWKEIQRGGLISA